MNRSYRVGTGIIGLLALGGLLTACATVVPPGEIETARVALQDARDAGAERLVTRRFDDAARQLAVAERTWREDENRTLATHQANLAEAAAREAQARARLIEAEAALERNRERKARAEAAVKDAEITLLSVQTRLQESEQRTVEAQARAAAAQAQAKATQQRLADQLAGLERELAQREAALQATAQQTEAAREQTAAERQKAAAERAKALAEREKAAAEVARLRGDLTRAQADAEAAGQAAEAERERLAEQRRANEARAAELARLQLQHEQLRKQQEESQKKLSVTLAELAEVREEARGLIVSLPGSIYFDFDRAEVRREMRSRLEEIARALSTVERATLLIEGHTDSDGASDYNLRLSELRAEAVRRILVASGVADERARAVGYGETRPRVPNATAAAKAQNRRVEIVIEDARPTTR